MKESKKVKKKRTSKESKTIRAARIQSKSVIVAALVGAVGVIVAALVGLVSVIVGDKGEGNTNGSNGNIQKADEENEKHLESVGNSYGQEFHMSEEIVDRAGIEYRRYEISSNPSINGFHVIPYVYVVLEIHEEQVYIPVEGQFQQEEYVAGQEGICILYRENTTESLLEALRCQGCDAEIECMLAIEYAVVGKAKVDVYMLRTGQLEVADEEKALSVIGAWDNPDSVRINMISWPVGSEEQLKEMLESIGYYCNP